MAPTSWQRMLGRWSVTWATWAVLGAFLVLSFWWLSSGPYADMDALGGIPDEDFGQTPTEAEAKVSGYGEEGRATYQAFLAGDMVFAALMGLASALLIARWLRRTDRFDRLHGLLFLPLAALAFDWLENIAFWGLSTGSAGWATVAVIANWAKFIAVIPSMLLALVAAAILFFKAMSDPMGRR